MNNKEIKILLNFQHFSKNQSLDNLIRKAHTNENEKDDVRITEMTEEQTEMVAAAGIENGGGHPKDRSSLIKSLGGLLLFLSFFLIFSCKQQQETIYINQSEIKTTEYTNINASQVAYYLQRYFTDAYGDKYIDEKAESYQYLDTEIRSVPAGTKISDIGKQIEGYEQYGFNQLGNTLTLYYKAKTVTYNFFLYKTDTVPVATISGKWQLPISIPATKSYSVSGKFARWKTLDGVEIPKTFGTTDQNYYAEWFTPFGKKEKPSNVGDIVFSDGTAIFYDGTISLTPEMKKNAIAVIVSTTYNRTTGHGTGYNEGRAVLGLGTLAYSGKWGESESYNRVTSQNDGRLSMAIIKQWYSTTNIATWVKDYAKTLEQTKGITLYGDLSQDWYLPAYYEWQQAHISSDLVKRAFDAIDFEADVIATDYWTSSNVKAVVSGSSDASWVIRTSTNNLLAPNTELSALVMREFK